MLTKLGEISDLFVDDISDFPTVKLSYKPNVLETGYGILLDHLHHFRPHTSIKPFASDAAHCMGLRLLQCPLRCDATLHMNIIFCYYDLCLCDLRKTKGK